MHRWTSCVSSSCPGREDIRLGGTAHLLITSTVDQAGNTHEVFHYNYQNTTAVGLESGDSYVLRTVNNSANNVRPSDPEETTNDGEWTYVLRGRMIRLGEGGTQLDDQMFRYTVYITQAENGEVTTQFEKYAEICN